MSINKIIDADILYEIIYRQKNERELAIILSASELHANTQL